MEEVTNRHDDDGRFARAYAHASRPRVGSVFPSETCMEAEDDDDGNVAHVSLASFSFRSSTSRACLVGLRARCV